MKKIKVPGFKEIVAENLIMDYNGTLAKNGKILDGVIDKLRDIKEDLNIYILTADTFGTVHSQFENTNIKIIVVDSEDSSISKRAAVESLGVDNSICIGNGYNDIEMMQVATLSIGIAQEEGMSGKLFLYSDMVFVSILDALDSIINPDRIIATLRG